MRRDGAVDMLLLVQKFSGGLLRIWQRNFGLSLKKKKLNVGLQMHGRERRAAL
jgi:hypothetical protein